MLNHLYCLLFHCLLKHARQDKVTSWPYVHPVCCSTTLLTRPMALPHHSQYIYDLDKGHGISVKSVGLSFHTSWKDKRDLFQHPAYTQLTCQNIFHKSYLPPFTMQPQHLDSELAQKWNWLHWTNKWFGTAISRVYTWKSKCSIES